MNARGALAAALACALCLAGCGLWHTPAAGRAAAGTASSTVSAPGSLASTLATAARTHELPTPVPRQTAPGFRSARAAVLAFARTYVNWTAATVSARMAALARVSVGQARSAMQLAAGQTRADTQLRQGGIANSGVVEALSALPGQPDAYVVVTRESTTATNTSVYEGLAPAWHVTVASVAELAPGRWALNGWQPES